MPVRGWRGAGTGEQGNTLWLLAVIVLPSAFAFGAPIAEAVSGFDPP
jgi:hypothetical protein